MAKTEIRVARSVVVSYMCFSRLILQLLDIYFFMQNTNKNVFVFISKLFFSLTMYLIYRTVDPSYIYQSINLLNMTYVY